MHSLIKKGLFKKYLQFFILVFGWGELTRLITTLPFIHLQWTSHSELKNTLPLAVITTAFKIYYDWRENRNNMKEA